MFIIINNSQLIIRTALFNRLAIIAALFLFSGCAGRKAYLFTSFHEPATDGLRLLYSKDGYHWKDYDTVFLKPEVGADTNKHVMRDPSMVQGPDGTFHLVWTSDWTGGNGFGYANSKDLLHWSKERYIDVMKNEPTVVNVWAPELFYDEDGKQYIIV
ncbi:glycosyl hydrolase, partial [Russula earlei]